MSDKALLDLAERCEAAAGADRALDHMIAARIGLSEWLRPETTHEQWTETLGPNPNSWVPCFTASLDAAMSLVPEGATTLIEFDGVNYYASVGNLDVYRIPGGYALAMCAAALRARAASAMSASGQDPKGLEAKPASAVDAEGSETPKTQSQGSNNAPE